MVARALTLSPPSALYPFATRRFRTDEGTMSYVDEGSGKPILFVHGTPSWSFEWREMIRALAPSHRVIAPDHLGFGLSDKPEDAPYKPADHARRLLALFDALDLREVTLVVHDFGGPIGLPIALERSDRVERVVIMNTWMWPLGQDRAAARASALVRSFVGRFLYLWLNFSPRVLVPASFGDRSKLTPEVHRHYLEPFRSRRDRTAPWVLGCELTGSDDHYARLWSRRDVLARTRAIIVWGERDPAFGTAHLDRWIEALPNADVVRLPRAGHFPQEEDPEAVIGAIRMADALPSALQSTVHGVTDDTRSR